MTLPNPQPKRGCKLKVEWLQELENIELSTCNPFNEEADRPNIANLVL